MAEILKNVGIGWLTLVIMGALAALALAVSLHGQVRIGRVLLPLGVLAAPGALLLVVGLSLERTALKRRAGPQEGRDP